MGTRLNDEWSHLGQSQACIHGSKKKHMCSFWGIQQDPTSSLQGWILSTILVALFCAKFACILAISNPVFRWDSCKGSEWDSVKNCSRLSKEIGTRGWISQRTSRQNVAHVPSTPKVEESRQLLYYRTKVPGWLRRLLVAWTHDST